jgi:hypothetical protein
VSTIRERPITVKARGRPPGTPLEELNDYALGIRPAS